MAFERWKKWAAALKRETLVVYAALPDPRTPWYAKVAAGIVVAYALSPIDLIPDPIPVLGYLDDLLLIPLGLWLVRKLISEAVMTDCRAAVENGAMKVGRVGLIGAMVVIGLWLLAAVGLIRGGLSIYFHAGNSD